MSSTITHASVLARQAHHGVSFAEPLHNKAEAATDPTATTLQSPFVVAILGSSRGIGAATALAYAKAGASGFVLTARDEASTHSTAKAIMAIRPSAKIVCQSVDVGKPEDVEAVATATRTAFGRLDVCIVNAGICEPVFTDDQGVKRWPRGVTEGPVDEFVKVMNTNFWGAYYAARFFLPLLEETSDGAKAFVAVNTAGAHYADSTHVPVSYSLSKMASARFVEQVAAGHADICAFSVHPGGVKTDMADNLPDHIKPDLLTDDVGLCGGMCVWLTKEKRPWLSGRWISSKWDTDALLKMKDDIANSDKLKFRMEV